MEKQIKIKSEYNSLEKVLEYLKKESPYEASIDYDAWDVRSDANGQMEKCVLVKKSAMHGLKVYFEEDDILNLTYIIPNKIMNAYFGKSQKKYQNAIEIITGKISQALLAGSQKQAFEEIEKEFSKITV